MQEPTTIRYNLSDKKTIKRLVDNFISLTLLQIINYIVPLITFPYLIRVLGIEQFGLYSFILAVIGYGIIVTEYGFDLSATKHISVNIDDKKKIDEIFSSVIIIKVLIAIFFFLFLFILVLFIDKFSKDAMLYFYASGLIIGQVLFPVWFFQGIEKMRYITMLNAISKFIFAVAIFIFVTKPSDLYLVFIFNSLGSIVAGILAFNIARTKFDVSFSKQSIGSYIFYIKDTWYIFTSRVAVQLYQSLNIIILAFFASNAVVGYYSIADKIVRIGGIVFVSLPNALYPYFAKLYNESKKKFYSQNIQLALVLFALMAPISLFVYFNAPIVLELVSGSYPPDLLISLMQILAPLLSIIVYGSQFTNILVIQNETKFLNKIVVIAGLVNLALVFLVIHFFFVIGLAWLNVFIAVCLIILPKAYFIFFKGYNRSDIK